MLMLGYGKYLISRLNFSLTGKDNKKIKIKNNHKHPSKTIGGTQKQGGLESGGKDSTKQTNELLLRAH